MLFITYQFWYFPGFLKSVVCHVTIHLHQLLFSQSNPPNSMPISNVACSVALPQQYYTCIYVSWLNDQGHQVLDLSLCLSTLTLNGTLIWTRTSFLVCIFLGSSNSTWHQHRPSYTGNFDIDPVAPTWAMVCPKLISLLLRLHPWLIV